MRFDVLNQRNIIERMFIVSAVMFQCFFECFKALRSCDNKTDDNHNNSQNISQFFVSFHELKTRKWIVPLEFRAEFEKLYCDKEKKGKKNHIFFWWELTEWARKTWKVLWQFVTEDDD